MKGKLPKFLSAINLIILGLMLYLFFQMFRDENLNYWIAHGTYVIIASYLMLLCSTLMIRFVIIRDNYLLKRIGIWASLGLFMSFWIVAFQLVWSAEMLMYEIKNYHLKTDLQYFAAGFLQRYDEMYWEFVPPLVFMAFILAVFWVLKTPGQGDEKEENGIAKRKRT